MIKKHLPKTEKMLNDSISSIEYVIEEDLSIDKDVKLLKKLRKKLCTAKGYINALKDGVEDEPGLEMIHFFKMDIFLEVNEMMKTSKHLIEQDLLSEDRMVLQKKTFEELVSVEVELLSL